MMDEEQKQIEYLKELGNQIRSEINEFYLVNAAFLTANSFLISFVFNFAKKPFFLYFLLILINFIWFIAIVISRRWKYYWLNLVKDELRKWEEECKGQNKISNIKSIWKDDYKCRFLNFFGLMRLFILLPIVFVFIYSYIFEIRFNGLNYIFWAVIVSIIFFVGKCFISEKNNDC